jgi:hypothetical protein
MMGLGGKSIVFRYNFFVLKRSARTQYEFAMASFVLCDTVKPADGIPATISLDINERKEYVFGRLKTACQARSCYPSSPHIF